MSLSSQFKLNDSCIHRKLALGKSIVFWHYKSYPINQCSIVNQMKTFRSISPWCIAKAWHLNKQNWHPTYMITVINGEILLCSLFSVSLLLCSSYLFLSILSFYLRCTQLESKSLIHYTFSSLVHGLSPFFISSFAFNNAISTNVPIYQHQNLTLWENPYLNTCSQIIFRIIVR